LEPGRYRITLRAADRGQGIYLPSNARTAIYLIPDDPTAIGAIPPLAPPSSGHTPTPVPPGKSDSPTGLPDCPTVETLERIPLEPCHANRAWCYNGGGELDFECGRLALTRGEGCHVRRAFSRLTSRTPHAITAKSSDLAFPFSKQIESGLGRPSAGSYKQAPA